MSLRLLICGDRFWTDGDFIYDKMADFSNEVVVIEGGAKGADYLAKIAAQYIGLAVVEYPAEWDTYGRAAGPKRNQRMIDEGRPDEVWAFHDNLAASRGTADMVRRARKAGLEVQVFSHAPATSPKQTPVPPADDDGDAP